MTTGTGFDAMLEIVTPSFRDIQITSPEGAGTFEWSLSLKEGTNVSILHASYNKTFSYVPNRSDESLVLRICHDGAAETCIRGHQVTSPPGTAVLASWRELERTRVISETDEGKAATSTFFVFAPSIVSNCMEDLFDGIALSQLELLPLLELDTCTGQTLNDLCSSLSKGMSGERLLERSPKAKALLVEATVRFVLEQIPHKPTFEPRGCRHQILPRHVRKAIDFMQGNLHTPITLKEIAVDAGVSTRALQLGFKQFLDTTPHLYLREIRLRAAHAELSAPGNILSVKEVALKWGFSHVGRFAAHYKATFGEAPSATARHLCCGQP